VSTNPDRTGLWLALGVGLALAVMYPVSPLRGQTPSRAKAAADTILHVDRILEIRYHVRHFAIAGNLYTPAVAAAAVPVVIWVSGSGPSVRTVTRPDTRRLVNCFLDRGMAYFRIDKPGSGESTGNLNPDSLFDQLSDVVVGAVAALKKTPGVAGNRIGLFGSSQAGYIMPLAISKCRDIAFMIGSSCPGENSVRQWEYLLHKQMICEGIPPEIAHRNIQQFRTLRSTRDKAEFDAAIEYFDHNPLVVSSVGYDSGFAAKARSWWPRGDTAYDESLFDPVTLVPGIDVPVFFAYGARDTQIDPLQAINAYSKAFRDAGKKKVAIVLLTASDHNMSLSGGCLNEIAALNRAQSYRLDPAFLETIAQWVDEITVGGR
jgi:uncharacterized protein